MNFRHRAAHFDGLSVPDKFRRQFHWTEQFQESMFRVSGGEDYSRRNLFAISQHHALHHLVFNTDFRYFNISSNFPAKPLRCVCKRLCDCPNSFHLLPLSQWERGWGEGQPAAIEPVVDESIACPCGHWTKRISMNRNRSNRGFHLFRFEIFFQKFLSSHG